MSTDPTSVAFDALITGSPTKTGIPVPNGVLDQLDAGQRPAVVVTLDGYTYQTSVGVMGGQHLVPVSAAIRKATGVAAGSHVRVTQRMHVDHINAAKAPETRQHRINKCVALFLERKPR